MTTNQKRFRTSSSEKGPQLKLATTLPCFCGSQNTGLLSIEHNPLQRPHGIWKKKDKFSDLMARKKNSCWMMLFRLAFCRVPSLLFLCGIVDPKYISTWKVLVNQFQSLDTLSNHEGSMTCALHVQIMRQFWIASSWLQWHTCDKPSIHFKQTPITFERIHHLSNHTL